MTLALYETHARMETVLVIDEEVGVLDLLTYNLEQEDLQVLTARTGGDGLAKLEESLPDLLIMDVLLGDMSGYELLDAIKRDPRFRMTPIIILSARATIQDRVDGRLVRAEATVSR